MAVVATTVPAVTRLHVGCLFTRLWTNTVIEHLLQPTRH